MTEPGDLGELARRYLDLWEENLSRMADDREVAEVMAKTIELMNSSTAAFASMAQSAVSDSAAPPKDGKEPKDDAKKDYTPPAGSSGQSRTPTASAAHGNTDHDLDEFAHRLAALEQRISNLESAYGKSGRGAGKKPKPG